jgi:hypothetical protein
VRLAFWANHKYKITARLFMVKRAGKQGGYSKLSNIFSRHGRFGQYMSERERKKLIRDYVWARDGYRKAVYESRRAYEELVRRGLIPDDNRKTEQ